MKSQKSLYVILLAAFISSMTAVVISTSRRKERQKEKQEQNDKRSENKTDTNTNPGKREPARPGNNEEPVRIEGFNRNEEKLVFTKHARCRMGCRHIDEAEVREILLKGRINDRKSEPAARPDPKYALEGKTRDGQEVRIIFAPSSRGMVVITVIDLDTEWPCDCK